MKATSENGKQSIGVWAIVCSLMISAILMVSLIQPQKAYAEMKKITATLKTHNTLIDTKIRTAVPTIKVRLNIHHTVLKSDDPDWNNTHLFRFIYPESTEEYGFKGYGAFTHPGGEQTFIEYVVKLAASKGRETSGEMKGVFIGGTGKFEGIKGRYMSKFKYSFLEGRTAEWEVEYEIK